METVVQPPADAEIHLLTEWGDASDRPRWQRAVILSVVFHAALIVAVALMPRSFFMLPQGLYRIMTPLVAPPDLTQKAPNNGEVNKEFNVAESHARRGIQIPPGPPPTTPPEQRETAVPPPPRLVPEPPKPDLAALPPAPAPVLKPPSPQIQVTEQPRFENPSVVPAPEPGAGRPLPRVADAIRSAAIGGGGGGNSVEVPPSPGMQPNAMQLLSDPMGVDFKPYLTQVLIAVKQRWLAIWPDSARMGRSGTVAIQFSIDKIGQVPKLVIASASGAGPLDRAAIVAIQQAIPFPPLPREYRGDLIKLQLNFAYNVSK